MLIQLNVVWAQRCSTTNDVGLCKDDWGHGPYTAVCSSECHGPIGDNTACDQTAGDCHTIVDCSSENGGSDTLTAVTIGTTRNFVYEYSSINGDKGLTGTDNLNLNNWNDWVTLSHPAECPLHSPCSIDTNKATSDDKGVYFDGDFLRVHRTLVYSNTNWDLTCSNYRGGAVNSNTFTTQVDCFTDADGDTINDILDANGNPCSIPEDPVYHWPCRNCTGDVATGTSTAGYHLPSNQMVVYDPADTTLHTL